MDYLDWKKSELGFQQEEKVEEEGPQKEELISGKSRPGKKRVSILPRGKMLEVGQDQEDEGQEMSMHSGW